MSENNFKFSPAAVPQSEVVVETHKAPVAPPIDYLDRSGWSSDMLEYDATAKAAISQPRSELNCILMLIQPPMWMTGLWSEVVDGWHDKRTGTDLTYDGARTLIADRIAELGLSPELVYAYPQSHSRSHQTFLNLQFAEQMTRLR